MFMLRVRMTEYIFPSSSFDDKLKMTPQHERY